MNIHLFSCAVAVVSFSVVACSAPTSDEIPSNESQATSDLSGGGGGGVPTECTKSECGPAPLHASRQCADGSVAGPTCGRNAKGTCGWSDTSCPTNPPVPAPPPSPVPGPGPLPQCGPDSCSGPRPLSPSFQCKDGSTAGPTCEATASGACGWVITSCP